MNVAVALLKIYVLQSFPNGVDYSPLMLHSGPTEEIITACLQSVYTTILSKTMNACSSSIKGEVLRQATSVNHDR
jgi:hypothetical protein